MAFNAKLPLLLFFISSFLLCFTSSLAYEKDPEQQIQQCRASCEKLDCKLKCGEQYVEQKRPYQLCVIRCRQHQRQCQQQCEEIQIREQEREERRSGDNNADSRREYEQCVRGCQQRGGSQQLCQFLCEDRHREQEREERRGGDNNADSKWEYQQCMRPCQRQGGSQQRRRCQEQCEKILREQEIEERRGGDNNANSKREEYEWCMRRCRQLERGSKQQWQCEQRCEEIAREQERGEGRLQQQQQQQEEERDNPYFFDEQSFIEKYKTEEGRIRVLPKFTQRSNLHRGIENYRLEIFEANPNTFVIPNHCDADAVVYVMKGKVTISMILDQKRNSFNLERGDVIKVPSGSVVYMVNRDNNEQLQLAKLYQPISKTGHFQEFFGVGGEDPESFYRTFSNDVLEAAFDTSIGLIEELFGQQRKGAIIKASKEQVQALSSQASRGPYNILNKRPNYSNNNGKLYEVTSDDYKQLQELDIAVSFANITKGAMMAPYYNTRATNLILVVEGRGRFEMAERKQEQEEERGGAQYQRVNASLSPKTMFIVPTGHPVVVIASDNENLQLVAFTINAQDSQRNFLAGRPNVANQIQTEALELGFNIPSRAVERVYNSQTESVFVPGPNQRRQQRERGSHGLSILDFVNF